MVLNPFYVYNLSFSFVIIIYLLGWSELFPKLSIGTILFFISTILLNLLLGRLFNRRIKIVEKNDLTNSKIYTLITLMVICGYILEFVITKNIPLLSVVLSIPNNYKDFGVPVFHVLLLTFNCFYATYIFQVYLANKSKKYLIEFILLSSLPLLIFNRGAFLFIVVSCTFIFLIKRNKRISKSLLIKLLLLIFTFSILFGVLGNLRLNNSVSHIVKVDKFSTELFLDIGGANEEFRNSIIPKPLFWVYIYTASPLANFQKTINESSTKSFEINEIDNFFISEVLIDSIGKRLIESYNLPEEKISQIAPSLTVGTVYAKSFIYLNWLGPVLIYILFILFVFSMTTFLKNNTFTLTGLSLLNTLAIFNTFDNMFSFTGFSFQFFYFVMFSLFFKVKRKEGSF
ncbi:hypothetical protein [Rossellomorea aquimaris]|uniref:hypothetical protein n=1 Tax=Rossellomorea aquimaris TaxID=189382 RepID=UPI0005C8BAB9|nr:hypothetical protein [Rossellomorea aquimaris]